MINKAFDQIGPEDFQYLVDFKVEESRTLEFKRELPGSKNEDRREFLSDITSLANAHGGDLIYGIADENGVAADACGVSHPNSDELIRSFEDRMLAGIQPRLMGVRTRWVPLSADTGFLIMRAPASFLAPHRVTLEGHGHFYSRTSRGKYRLDTHELRDAFTGSEVISEKFLKLHQEAVSYSCLPFSPSAEPKSYLSVTPLSFFRERVDISDHLFEPIAPFDVSGGINNKILLEGVVWHLPLSEFEATSDWVLTHRGGRIDWCWHVGGSMHSEDAVVNRVYPQKFERGIASLAERSLQRLRLFGLEGPWVIQVSVLGLKDSIVCSKDGYTQWRCRREGAQFQQLVIDDYSESDLLPIFQSFWRLYGCERPENRNIADAP